MSTFTFKNTVLVELGREHLQSNVKVIDKLSENVKNSRVFTL